MTKDELLLSIKENTNKLPAIKETVDRLVVKNRLQNEAVSRVLYAVLDTLNIGNIPLSHVGNELHVNATGNEWDFYKEIYFSAFKAEDIAKGRDYDFMSSFTLNVSNKGIKVNYGGCGEWGKDDKGQLSRLRLINKIFDNEDALVRRLNEIIDKGVIIDLYNARNELDIVRTAIKTDTRLVELIDCESELSVGKWIAELTSGAYDRDKYFFISELEIKKITEKTIECRDPNWPASVRRLNKREVLNLIRTGRACVNESRGQTPTDEQISRYKAHN